MKAKKIMKLMLGFTIIASSLSFTSCNPTGSEVTTVKFWHTFGGQVQIAVDTKISEFEKIYMEKFGQEIDVVSEYQGGYVDILKKINLSFSSGSTPTVAVAYPDHVAEYLSSQTKPEEYVINLEKYFDDEKIGFAAQEYFNPNLKGEEDLVPSFLDEGQNYINDGTYSFPFMKSSEVLLYNKTMVDRVLKDMGIPNTEGYMRNLTWEKFIAILKFANDDLTKYGSFLAVPYAHDSDSNLFISQCFQRGIDFISIKDGKGSIDFNNPQARELIREIKGYYDDGLLVTKGTEGKYSSDIFKDEECMFTVGSTGGAGYNDPGQAGFDVGVCKVPSAAKSEELSKYVSQGVTLTLLNNTGVSAEENKARTDIGWQLIKYLTSSDNNVDICLDTNGYAPVRESSYTSATYSEYLAEDEFMPKTARVVYEDIAGKYFNYPVFKGSATAREAVGGLVTQALLSSNFEGDLDKLFKDAENLARLALKN